MQEERRQADTADLRSLLIMDVLALISLSSCICDVLAMVNFNLELCATEPCLPRLSLTECSITATGKEADTLYSVTSPASFIPPIFFSSMGQILPL